MTDEEFDQEENQWTEETRERFRTTATALIDAITRNSEVLLQATALPDDYIEIHDKLADAAGKYADAHYDYAGTFPALGLFSSSEDEDEDEDENDAEQSVVAKISVLRRTDYRVADIEAVLEAGRRSYLEVWDEDTEEDAREDVSHLGRALYQIEHNLAPQPLNQIEGLRRAGAITWVLKAAEVLGDVDPDEWPEDPFAVGPDADTRLLHRLDEIDM